MVVVFDNQLANLPANRAHRHARETTAASMQAPLVAQLKQVGATHITGLSILNAVAAAMPAAEARALSHTQGVKEVVPDGTIIIGDATSKTKTVAGSQVQKPAIPATAADGQQSCNAPGGKPLLEPEALTSIHDASNDPSDTQEASSIATGQGVIVGNVDADTLAGNPNLIRPTGSTWSSTPRTRPKTSSATAPAARLCHGVHAERAPRAASASALPVAPGERGHSSSSTASSCGRTRHEDEDENEREHLAVRGAELERADVRVRDRRLDDAEHEAGRHRAQRRAEADDERRDEALEPEQRAGVDVHGAARRRDDRGDRGEPAGDAERERDERVDGDADDPRAFGVGRRSPAGRGRSASARAPSRRPPRARARTPITKKARTWIDAPPTVTKPSRPMSRNGSGSGKT